MTNTLNLFIKITPSKLPENAKRFIECYFSKVKIVYIDKIKDEYEVKLSNGTYINFDKNGDWNYIISDDMIKENVLPRNIANKVKSIMKRYNNASIFEINKRINFYRIKLTNSLELCISHKGDLLA
ncbi:PepSY-like domain-containing protein [Brachyspira pulli]|uniref:PepSY-like domain-containing protein n=1 Tax=Brachyspira pulli TaxID=310721 RepID=UPI003003E0B0